MSRLQWRDDLLYVVVIGPGFGESVVVRIPGGHWLLIDSCLIGARNPSLNLLGDDEIGRSFAILTHPHLDHVCGFDGILNRRGVGVVGCADPRIEDWQSWSGSPDADDRHVRGIMEQVMAGIHERWERDPASRWLIRRGDSRPIGPATMTALHPDEDLASALPHPGPNRLSAAMLIEWEEVRILLGADVEAADWAAIAAAHGDLGNHQVMKVPHHGSLGAFHVSYAEGARDRVWIVTPWNRGRRLPRFEDGQGVDRLLRHVPRLHLTGLPVAFESQGTVPDRATRADFRDGLIAAARVPIAAGLTAVPAPAMDDPLACHVLVSWDRTGQIQEERYGRGSVVVEE